MTTTTTTKQASKPEVILSAWEVQALDEAGEWQTMNHEATKAEALAASLNYLASGCTVRVVWSAA